MNPLAKTLPAHALMSGYRLLQVDKEGELHVRLVAKVLKPRSTTQPPTGFISIWFADGPNPRDPAQAPHAEVATGDQVVVFGD